MILELRVSNFLSFKDEQVFSMIGVQRLKEQKNNLVELARNVSGLKSAAIFGANASGKTNLMNAVAYLIYMIKDSFKNSNNKDAFTVPKFALNKGYKNKPTLLEITVLVDNSLYRYGVSISDHIEKEWLFCDEELAFDRQNGQLIVGEGYNKKAMDLRLSLTNDYSLFLTVLATTDTKWVKPLYNYFLHKIIIADGINHNKGDSLLKQYIKDKNSDALDKVLKLIKNVDIGIENLTLEERPFSVIGPSKEEVPEEVYQQLMDSIQYQSEKIITTHNVYDDSGKKISTKKFVSLDAESSGTNVFLSIIGPIIYALENGATIFIDEMDAQLHPLLAKKIIQLFNRNDTQAQLVITTHNTTLLDITDTFRRDQIWFTEKDKVEASYLICLSDFREKGKVIRNDTRVAKNYLRGKYGATPLIKDLNSIFYSKKNNEKTEG